MEPIITAITAGLAVAALVGFFVVIPYQMAEARGRSPILWVLASLFISPILAILLLALLGNAPKGN